MLAQTDIERERYESRRKAQLDDNTRMNFARNEGRVEGRLEGLTKGEKIGMILLCEQMLNRPETPDQHLHAMSLDELTRLANDLRGQLTRQI